MSYPGQEPRYTAKAALVLATDYSGARIYLYQGRPVPDSIPHAEIARLANEGLIEKSPL